MFNLNNLIEDISNKFRKINIIWIVNDLYINNFITVYNECQKNKKFKITIIATSHTGFNKSDNISSTQVFNFLKKNNIKCINSWNKIRGKYINLFFLKPDYIFTTTPYDIYLPEPYKSYNLKKIGKLCHVEYGVSIIKCTGIYKNFFETNPFYKNIWMLFTSNEQEYFKIPCKYKAIGCLKLDQYIFYNKSLDDYNWHNKKNLKIVWKPRWTLDSEDSTLLKYLKPFYFFLRKYPKINFVFLFHPLLISNIDTKGYSEIFNKWVKKLNKLPNFAIENSSDFLNCVLGADVLIADHSSTIVEFANTGKPLIYTNTKTKLNNLGKKIINTAYKAENFKDIENILINLLNKKDPMKRKRIKKKNSYFFKPPNKLTIAQFLLKILYDDYYHNNKTI